MCDTILWKTGLASKKFYCDERSKIVTDFLKSNGHIRSSFLFHLCVQNSLSEEKGSIKTSKSIVQTKVEEEYIRLRFDA